MRWNGILGSLVVLLALAWVPAQAQTAVNMPPAKQSCQTVTVNSQGTSNAAVSVDNTSGGKTVLAASTTRCGAIITNLAGGGDMLCGPSTIVVTTTVGYYISAGQSLVLGTEGQQAWKCIRQAGSNATAYVVEATQ